MGPHPEEPQVLRQTQPILQLKAHLLSAIAHPTRLAILGALRHEELTVTALAGRLSLKQANCSQHLSILHSNGAVSRQKVANQVHYSMSVGGIVLLLDAVDTCFREILAKKAGKRPG